MKAPSSFPCSSSLAFGSTALAGIAGVQVFEANRTIINALKADGVLIVEKSYVHSYPHCWRCRNPLIYRAITSWYVKVTEFKDRMSELNEQINWIPENVKYGQFGKWVENARDWSISRNRFWGSPIPVWVSDDPNYPRVDVYGSLEELKADFGRLPLNKEGQPDLHRPYIDELTRPNPDDPTGKSTMRRVEDVLDVWFDSGSMPYAQVHYPFENKDWFENHYPADFIVEYIGQTRGWFYTLHILATALFDRPAFKNVVSHGIVLGSDGQKMSKSLRNYPDVSEVLDRDGSDAMRWFLMSSPILRGGNLIVTEQGIREGVRQVMLPLWNVYHFFALYANAANKGAGYTAQVKYDSQHVMDRFILGKTRELIQQVTADMDSYDIWSACEHLRLYADALTNWYVRRSRERFFDEDPDAFDTLYTALVTVSKVAASLLPLTTEEIYRGLTGERSVHLADWPIAEDFADESELLSLMETVRAVCSVGSSLRKEKKIRVRQPLQSLTAAITDEQIAELKKFKDDVDFEVAAEFEKKLRHDVMAHVHTYGEQAKNARKIIHLGATSAYVGDNTDLIQIKEGLLVVKRRMLTLIEKMRDFALEYKDLPTLGFTHFQAAQLTTVGKRATLWLHSLLLDFEELEFMT